MLAFALTCLVVAAAPELLHPEAGLEVAFVPPKGALAPAVVTKACEPFAKKKGRSCRVDSVSRASYPGLSAESLEYTAAGLAADERARLAKTTHATYAVLSWPAAELEGLREAYELALLVAKKSDAFIYDRNAASAFTAASWKARRLEGGWAGPLPIADMHFNVHLVPQLSELVMLDTGGLRRFGLDDFELLDVNRYTIRSAADLVNLVAQRLVEGARPDAKGRLTVRVAELKYEELKKTTQASLYDNGTGEVVVSFVAADPAHGARQGALELAFPEVKGKDRGERLDAALKRLYGWKDEVGDVDHDDPKVKAAMARAAAALRTYEGKVKKGLPQGELLLVKAPFKYEGGNEWMWVDVQAWNGKKLRGRLENEPELATSVRAGATVEVNLDDVADYMYQLPDGSFFGNEMGRVLQPKLFEVQPDGRARVRR